MQTNYSAYNLNKMGGILVSGGLGNDDRSQNEIGFFANEFGTAGQDDKNDTKTTQKPPPSVLELVEEMNITACVK
jgi:hypothetical protein